MINNHVKTALYISVLFLFFTLYLGEVEDYYNRYWWWDLAMHFKSGVCIAFFLSVLVRGSDWYIVFCVTVTALVTWEVFEYLMDVYGNFNMQKDGIKDTMEDIIIGMFGAFSGVVFSLVYNNKNNT